MCKVTVECLAGYVFDLLWLPLDCFKPLLTSAAKKACAGDTRLEPQHVPRPPPSSAYGARSGAPEPSPASGRDSRAGKRPASPPQNSPPQKKTPQWEDGPTRRNPPTDDPPRPQPYRSPHDDGTSWSSKRPAATFHDSAPPPKAARSDENPTMRAGPPSPQWKASCADLPKGAGRASAQMAAGSPVGVSAHHLPPFFKGVPTKHERTLPNRAAAVMLRACLSDFASARAMSAMRTTQAESCALASTWVGLHTAKEDLIVMPQDGDDWILCLAHEFRVDPFALRGLIVGFARDHMDWIPPGQTATLQQLLHASEVWDPTLRLNPLLLLDRMGGLFRKTTSHFIHVAAYLFSTHIAVLDASQPDAMHSWHLACTGAPDGWKPHQPLLVHCWDGCWALASGTDRTYRESTHISAGLLFTEAWALADACGGTWGYYPDVASMNAGDPGTWKWKELATRDVAMACLREEGDIAKHVLVAALTVASSSNTWTMRNRLEHGMSMHAPPCQAGYCDLITMPPLLFDGREEGVKHLLKTMTLGMATGSVFAKNVLLVLPVITPTSEVIIMALDSMHCEAHMVSHMRDAEFDFISRTILRVWAKTVMRLLRLPHLPYREGLVPTVQEEDMVHRALAKDEVCCNMHPITLERVIWTKFSRPRNRNLDALTVYYSVVAAARLKGANTDVNDVSFELVCTPNSHTRVSHVCNPCLCVLQH